MMLLILVPCAADKVVQGLHLDGHVCHLGVYYPDGLFVYGFGCRLDGSVVFVDRLARVVSICVFRK